MGKERDPYIDIIKAIGIISIVIGHSSSGIFGKIHIGRFVYMYHLMVFFFVSGMCFKKEYSKDWCAYAGRKMKSLYPMFVSYGIIFVLLHNLLLSYGFFLGEQYSVNDMILKISDIFLMRTSEYMLGACWLLPVLFFAGVLFCFLFGTAEKRKSKFLMHMFLCLSVAVLGIYINKTSIQMTYHIHTAFLAIPVMYVGYLVKTNFDIFEKYINGWGVILAGIVLYVLALSGNSIELSAEKIGNPYLFYPVTLLGMYFCLGLAKKLEQNRTVCGIFSMIGRNSFHIMVLHFSCFKIVDIVYGKIISANKEVVSRFPTAFSLSLWYWFFGIFFPILCVEGVKFCKKRLWRKTI